MHAGYRACGGTGFLSRGQDGGASVKGTHRDCRRRFVSEAIEILLDPGVGSRASHLHQVGQVVQSALSSSRAPSSVMTSVASRPGSSIRFIELPQILPSSISLVTKAIARISRISEE
jgi:hypothetical protein